MDTNRSFYLSFHHQSSLISTKVLLLLLAAFRLKDFQSCFFLNWIFFFTAKKSNDKSGKQLINVVIFKWQFSAKIVLQRKQEIKRERNSKNCKRKRLVLMAAALAWCASSGGTKMDFIYLDIDHLRPPHRIIGRSDICTADGIIG